VGTRQEAALDIEGAMIISGFEWLMTLETRNNRLMNIVSCELNPKEKSECESLVSDFVFAFNLALSPKRMLKGKEEMQWRR